MIANFIETGLVIGFFIKAPIFLLRREATGKRGRGGNSFSPHPFFFPPRRRKIGQDFFSKTVRALFSIDHQTGNCKFWRVDSKTCSPRLRARLARNWAAKSNGGTKSQDAIFSEMRRFVITKLWVKVFKKVVVQKLSFPIFHQVFRLRRN